MPGATRLKLDGGIQEWARGGGRRVRRPGRARLCAGGGWTAETNHDPFLPLLLAAEHTRFRLELGTNIAVAFAA